MRYSIQPRYKKYLQGYGFLSYARKFGNKYGKKVNTGISSAKKFSTSKYGKKIIDTTKQEGINFGKIAGKNILTRSAEVTGDLIGYKIANKITSLGNKPNNVKNRKNNQKKLFSHQKKDNKLLTT